MCKVCSCTWMLLLIKRSYVGPKNNLILKVKMEDLERKWKPAYLKGFSKTYGWHVVIS